MVTALAGQPLQGYMETHTLRCFIPKSLNLAGIVEDVNTHHTYS